MAEHPQNHAANSNARPAEKPPGAAAPARKPDDDSVDQVYDSQLIRRLARYLWPYWAQALISTIAVTLKSMSDVAGPFLIMVGIDHYFPAGELADHASAMRGFGSAHWLTRHLSANPMTGITQLAEIYFALLLAALLFEFVQTYLMQWTGQKIMFDLRRDIFRHMQRMHIGFFDQHAVGRLVTRITSDVDAINEMFTGGILAIVDDIFTLGVMAIFMLKIKWWLALLAFSVLPVILFATRLFRNHVRESYRRVRAAIARINSFTQEHVTGMSIVQLFNREARAYKDFSAVNRQHMVAFIDTIFAYALYYPAVEILSSVAIA
ncbi:MAG TPA: ABC transporter ATP-binding protein, partial [Terracidiphilus sp.]|nr:ABC transporter ATP-binding protein [Terracidiphilus sp.]